MAALAALNSAPQLWYLPRDVQCLGNDLVAVVFVLLPLIVVHDVGILVITLSFDVCIIIVAIGRNFRR